MSDTQCIMVGMFPDSLNDILSVLQANVRYDIAHSNTHMWDLMEDMDFDPTLTQLFVR